MMLFKVCAANWIGNLMWMNMIHQPRKRNKKVCSIYRTWKVNKQSYIVIAYKDLNFRFIFSLDDVNASFFSFPALHGMGPATVRISVSSMEHNRYSNDGWKWKQPRPFGLGVSWNAILAFDTLGVQRESKYYILTFQWRILNICIQLQMGRIDQMRVWFQTSCLVKNLFSTTKMESQTLYHHGASCFTWILL